MQVLLQDLHKKAQKDFFDSLSDILDITISEDSKWTHSKKIVASQSKDYYALQSIFDFLISPLGCRM
jgi:hypothetical protein